MTLPSEPNLIAQLEKLAKIRFGVAIRGGNTGEGPTLHQLRLTDFTENRKLALGPPNPVSTDSFDTERHRIRSGEIVLCNREARFVANIAPGDLDAFAGSQMIVIHVTQKDLLPEYLLWWLNQPEAVQAASTKATGAYNRVIPTSAVRKLPVPLPPIEIQKRIVEIDRLLLDENRLTREFLEKKTKLVALVAKKLINRN